ncbi:endonuclease domain-containing protein [Methylocystis sp. SC2]|uniref:endonuclease domain-containing protein n=1 Tax=Methylocystis sp. (strain SC2) TaxID=187303 RepID=UPI0009FFBBC4|nr:endonuclease domain-containing protein [Methylocystis sp. SC2]
MSRIPRNVMLRLAKVQRANAVKAETIIWRALRARKEQLKFRRPVPIGDYIADFVCFERRIVVEVDGPSHASEEQQKRDKAKERWFGDQGFFLLRLENDLVIGSPELAVQKVMEAAKRTPPHPAGSAGHLLPQGEKVGP